MLRAKHYSAQMSKTTNGWIGGLTQSGTGCFIAIPIWQQWRQRVDSGTVTHRRVTFRIPACQSIFQLSRKVSRVETALTLHAQTRLFHAYRNCPSVSPQNCTVRLIHSHIHVVIIRAGLCLTNASTNCSNYSGTYVCNEHNRNYSLLDYFFDL